MVVTRTATAVVVLFAVATCAFAAPTRGPMARLSKPVAELTGYSLLGVSEAEHVAVHGQVSDAQKIANAQAIAERAVAGVKNPHAGEANQAGGAGGAPAFGTCMNCVYVLERIKQGYQYLLPSICVEIFSKEGSEKGKEAYGMCHQVLASLSVWGNNVRHWFHYGCYKSEVYGAMELIRPCPSHVICAQMADFEKKTFCKKLDQDKLLDA